MFVIFSGFAYISLRKRKRELVILLKLSSCYLVTVSVLCLCFTVPWVCVQCTILVFVRHNHFLSYLPTYLPTYIKLLQHITQ